MNQGNKIDHTRNNTRCVTLSIIHVRCSKMILQWVLMHPLGYKEPQKTEGQIAENEDDILGQIFVCIQILNFTIYLIQYAVHILIIFMQF